MTLSPESETESSNSSSSSPIISSPSMQSKQTSGTMKDPPFAREVAASELFSAGRVIRDAIGNGDRSLETSGVKLEGEEEEERIFSFQLEKSETDFDRGREAS